VLTLRQRMLRPSHLISLGQLDFLRGIDFNPRDGLRVGALTRHAEVADHPAVRHAYPMLATMASQLANPQVRNQGTLGGNLCYADPATDPPACLLALDARVVLGSHRGQRELPLREFLVDYFTTAIEPDELLLEVRLPAPPADAVGRYARYRRTAAEHRPLVTLGLIAGHGGSGRCQDLRLSLGASVAVAQRLPRAEAILNGQPVTAERIWQCAMEASAEIDPLDDARGSAAYRRAMVRVQVERTLADAFDVAVE
jgi:carbon-monoxide dehydrogenase medium subunit